jgi:hypothetical protein
VEDTWEDLDNYSDMLALTPDDSKTEAEDYAEAVVISAEENQSA